LIWSTPTGIFRSQTDGSDRLTLAETPQHRIIRPHLAESVILYEDGNPDTGITMRRANVNGSGTQALAVLDEPGQSITQFLLDAIGSWVIYGNNGLAATRLHSVTLDGVESQGGIPRMFYQSQIGGRAILLQHDLFLPDNLFSVLPDFTDLRQLTDLSTDPFVIPQTTGAIGNQVLYSLEYLPSASIKDLFAVPVTGGPVTTIANSPDYEWLGAVVGSRVVYHRCAVDATQHVGQCDLYSVQSDGTGTVALSTHPDNETIQGVIGSQVIVRRNSGTTDSLTVSRRVEEPRSRCLSCQIQCTNLSRGSSAIG
jgi:hypothetical protein